MRLLQVVLGAEAIGWGLQRLGCQQLDLLICCTTA
jgi:hypothetical protein